MVISFILAHGCGRKNFRIAHALFPNQKGPGDGPLCCITASKGAGQTRVPSAREQVGDNARGASGQAATAEKRVHRPRDTVDPGTDRAFTSWNAVA
jgi:hypothetical protein